MEFETLKNLAAQTAPADVGDALRTLVGNPEIKRNITGLRFVGEGQFFGKAVTARLVPARPDFVTQTQKDSKEASGFVDPLMYAISLCDEDSVLAVEAAGQHHSSIGGGMKLSGLAAQRPQAFLTDGSLRDSADFEVFAKDFGMRTMCTGFTNWLGTRISVFAYEVNVPIGIHGALILPTDYIFGDADGVVVIPGADAERVLSWAGVLTREYELAAQKMRDGKLLYGKDVNLDDAHKEEVYRTHEHEWTELQKEMIKERYNIPA